MATLGAICDSVDGVIRTGPFGSQLHQHDYVDDPVGLPIVMPKNIIDGQISELGIARIGPETVARLASHQMRPGDIVMARRGDIGRRALIDYRTSGWFCGTGSLRVSLPDSELDSRFLYYYLGTDSAVGWLRGQAVGATMPNLNTDIIRRLVVPVPPRQVQEKIAAVLAAYDELLENNRRTIEILEEMAQAVYREWFVNFRFPGHEDVAMVDSSLGPIPEGWKVSTLGDESSVVMGQSPKSEFYNVDGNGLPFHQGVTHFGALFPEHEKFCTVESRVAEAGDTLVSVRAPVGRINVADTRMVIGRGLAAIRNLDDECPGFHYRQLRHVFREEDSMGSGTIYKAITKGDLVGIHWLVPPDEIRATFESLERPLFSLTANLTTQIRNLRTTRDLLLPKLLSGEIDVSELDIDTEWLSP